MTPVERLRETFGRPDLTAQGAVPQAIDALLTEARAVGASDIHLLPTDHGLDIRWRIDGVLHPVGTLPQSVSAQAVARLKVLAELLTYRTDVPQEGRLRHGSGGQDVRISTLPTLHGEKAVVRLFAATGRHERLVDLGLPPEVESTLGRVLSETSGMIVLSGPSGSGKTTTLYACLREVIEAHAGGRSVISLEDPIEVPVAGVAQSQVNQGAGYTLAEGLRAVVRQDPEVIAVGEIRDRATAEVAFQAALTGHLVVCTFHAGGAAGAVGRLADMGIEPYVLRSGLRTIVAQRLVRKLCRACAEPSETESDRLGLDVTRAWRAVGCPACGLTGYAGRMVLAEALEPDAGRLGRAILSKRDVRALERLARRGGMIDLAARARDAVETGRTSPAEVRRVLGFREIAPE